MNRNEVAERIRWKWIMVVMGFMNPGFMFPQLVKVWDTRDVQGISLLTLVLLVMLQVAFSLHGFFIRDKTVMWSNGAAALMSLAVTLSTLYLM